MSKNSRINRYFIVFFSIAILIVIALALYWRVLGFEYIWDDYTIYLERQGLIGHELNWRALSEPVLTTASYFRPLIFLTFWMESKFSDPDPMISHAINVILFIINALLIFLLGRKLAVLSERKRPELIALSASLIYIVHPALVETTAWVSGRFDIMATLFILLASVIYVGAFRKVIKITLISLCMLLSLASKEIGIILPVILYCLWMAENKKNSYGNRFQILKRGFIENKAIFLALIGVFLIYWLIRIQSMPATFGGRFNIDYIIDVWFKEMLPVDTLRFYLIQAFLPFREVAAQHPQSVFLGSWGGFSIWGNILTLAILVLSLMIALVKRSMASWLFLAGLACLLPVLHFSPMTIDINIGHERFLTTPLAFWVLAIALIRYDLILNDILKINESNIKKKSYEKLLIAVFFSWVAFASITTYSVIPLWKNDLTLWGWMNDLFPGFTSVRYNYWRGALIAGRLDLIQREVMKVEKESETTGIDIKLQPLYVDYFMRVDDSKALLYAKGLVAAFPKYHNELDSPKQIYSLKEKFPLSPDVVGFAYADLSLATLMYEGAPELAMKYNEISLWYYDGRNDAQLLRNRATLLYALGRFDEAKKMDDVSDNLYQYGNSSEEVWRRHNLARYCVTIEMGGYCSDLLERQIILQEDISALKMYDLMKDAKKKNVSLENYLIRPE